MDAGQLSAILISSAGLVLIYNGCYYSIHFPKRISIVFAVITGLVTFLYLTSNPEMLKDVQSRIALGIVGLVMATISLIKNRQ